MYVWNKIESSSNSSSKFVLDDNGHLPIPKDPIIQISQKENPKFEKWTILKLQNYLGDRDINRSGNEQTLVINALGAFNMNLPVTATDAQEELHETNQDVFKKRYIENGSVQTSNPQNLKNGWTEVPANFPDTLLPQIMAFFIEGLDTVRDFFLLKADFKKIWRFSKIEKCCIALLRLNI